MKISVVIPVFNEEDVLPLLKERLTNALSKTGISYEVILINDGSHDRSAEFIQQWIRENPTISLIDLSRNFGHQPAITAGLAQATGDAVVVMDADLQDPPEVIPQLIEKWKEGYKIVLAERQSRGESFFRRCIFKFFYAIFLKLSELPSAVTSGVFGLMDRVVVDHLINLEERNRFIPGLRGWLGFNTATVYYERQTRAAGDPKQSLRRLIKYGLDAIFSFSYKPLRISFVSGFVVSMFCFFYSVVLVILRLWNINVVSGFTTIAVALLFLGGILLMSNGILGEYLGRIYDEVKRRPLYIVSRTIRRDPTGDRLIIENSRPQRENG